MSTQKTIRKGARYVTMDYWLSVKILMHQTLQMHYPSKCPAFDDISIVIFVYGISEDLHTFLLVMTFNQKILKSNSY